MAAGRPPIFQTPDEMQEAIDAFYEECEQKKQHPTVSGLAYALGMTTEGLRAYGERDEFSATVKAAKQRVEMAVEQSLLTGRNATGAIFNLKNNFGWKDKTEQDITSSDGSLMPTVIQLVGPDDESAD